VKKKKTHQVKKKNTSGREDVQPQNRLNGLILLVGANSLQPVDTYFPII
jgi:hypothetical protein